MKRKISPLSTVIGFIFLFLLIAVVVTVAMIVYTVVEDACNGNRAVIAGVMFAVIVVLSLICALIDFVRRKYTVNRTVNAILEATDKIASGDFSVRLKPFHALRRYDEYDYIIENLNKMAEELSHTEVLHTDFISNFSHEIKTPLSIIQNYSSSLQSAKLDEETRLKYTQTLCSASRRLTALITNILKLNKLEHLSIKPEYEKVRIDEMLAEAVFGFEDVIENKKLVIDCELEETEITSSPAYLEIVWNNLISNAVKFTPEGGKIFISVKNDCGKAVVTVRDSGCGISPETGKHIFEKFYQGDTSHSQEGNGLGLALVKKVIDLTGGTISVESQVDKGTTFTVALG